MPTETSSTWKIREAVIADTPEVARLAAELGYPDAAATIDRRLRALLNDPAHRVWVADTGTGLAGWAAAEWRHALAFPERVELTGLVVDAVWRGRGVGGRLLAAAEAWACETGARELFLGSNVQRDAAHVFYPRHGYTLSKTQHIYVKSPHRV